MEEFSSDDIMGLPTRDIQLYLDVNCPGHRIFSISVMGSENIHLRVVGPKHNLTIKGTK